MNPEVHDTVLTAGDGEVGKYECPQCGYAIILGANGFFERLNYGDTSVQHVGGTGGMSMGSFTSDTL